MHFRVRAFFRGVAWGLGVLGFVSLYALIVSVIASAVYDRTGSPPATVATAIICIVPTIFGIINAFDARG